jgi:uncharacterized zinc-type alcohol dehydrogenase-like protein
MAVQLAKAMGANVSVISTSPDKREAALKLGARNFIVSTQEQQMKAFASKFDLILSTIPQSHDANQYLPLIRRDGSYLIVGCLVPLKAPLDMTKMFTDRRNIQSSLIGGIAQTQEVLDFCGKHNIVSRIELIGVDDINKAIDRVHKGEVDFRYVIDMASIKGKKPDESLAAKVGL